MGWDGGGLRFTAPGLSSRAAVNLNPPRHAGILKLAAAAAARLTSLPRRRGLRLRLTAAAARITAMPGDGVGVGMVTGRRISGGA